MRRQSACSSRGPPMRSGTLHKEQAGTSPEVLLCPRGTRRVRGKLHGTRAHRKMQTTETHENNKRQSKHSNRQSHKGLAADTDKRNEERTRRELAGTTRHSAERSPTRACDSEAEHGGETDNQQRFKRLCPSIHPTLSMPCEDMQTTSGASTRPIGISLLRILRSHTVLVRVHMCLRRR